MPMKYSGDNLQFPDNSIQNTAPTGFGFKNRIINGAMMIDQRNAGASVTPTTDPQYTVDRWKARASVSSKFSVQQKNGVDSGASNYEAGSTPAGFRNSVKITSLSAYSAGATEAFGFQQNIEGYNVADMGWGAAGASSFTMSFWVKSSLTGTFSGVLYNQGNTRNYNFSYTINNANTWEQKTITIAGDTGGTWVFDNQNGLQIWWDLGTGSTYTGSAQAWTSTWYARVTGSQSIIGTNGATFYITGVQLEKGSTATSFDYRPYGTELALCQRYYEYGALIAGGYAQISAVLDHGASATYAFKARKRATPTMTNLTRSAGVHPNETGMNVPVYEGGYSRGFTHVNASDFAFRNITTGSGGSAGAANFLIVWTAEAEL